MFTLHSNQYIPYNPKSLPSGMPACATYYYLRNADGKVVDFKTLKSYKGKQMNRYAMHSKVEAEAYLEVINKRYERVYTVTNIRYDTDGEKVKLPKVLIIEVPEDEHNSYNEIEHYISEEISNRTGFCHEGFATTPQIPEK